LQKSFVKLKNKVDQEVVSNKKKKTLRLFSGGKSPAASPWGAKKRVKKLFSKMKSKEDGSSEYING
jgi:hypothetical protein